MSIHSSMGSTKSTREVRVGERPDACWQRNTSRNMAATRTATVRPGTATAAAMARTDTTVATSTPLTTANGTGGSPPWQRRPPVSSVTRLTLSPLWRRNAPTPSAEVTRNSLKERWRNVCVLVWSSVMLGFFRLHRTSPEVPCNQAGGRLDLPRALGNHHGAGQLDDGLR